MKIVLVKPYNLSDHIQPSLGLGYLASACRGRNNVILIDCIKEGLKIDGLLKKINSLQPDVVGFQCYTFDLKFVKTALKECKNLKQQIITIIGGPHPSAAPRDSFEYFNNYLDFIFVGEAERSLPLLLDRLEDGLCIDLVDIPGLGWKDGSNVRINPQIFIKDLDSLGMPAWDIIRPEEYPASQHGAYYKKFPIAPIMMTRGCPFQCSFCAGNIISGRKIRNHSIDFMLQQIKYLYSIHKIREFHIVDDNFTFDSSFAKIFLKKLIALDLDISWATPNGVRIDTLDEELLNLMKKSGLYLISLGIESGSDRILNLMKKRLTVKEIREKVNMIHRLGIEMAGFFIIGFPGETKDDMKSTIKLSLDLGLIRANYFTYLPFPGTSSYKGLVSKGDLNNINWDKFYFMNAAYVPQGMTRQELKNLQRMAFFKFYFRPSILWKNLSEIKSFRHLFYLLKRFFHWIIMS
ncbi:MAG: radical SAM protein [Candidatus Omnitrophota bacterium]